MQKHVAMHKKIHKQHFYKNNKFSLIDGFIGDGVPTNGKLGIIGPEGMPKEPIVGVGATFRDAGKTFGRL